MAIRGNGSPVFTDLANRRFSPRIGLRDLVKRAGFAFELRGAGWTLRINPSLRLSFRKRFVAVMPILSLWGEVHLITR